MLSYGIVNPAVFLGWTPERKSNSPAIPESLALHLGLKRLFHFVYSLKLVARYTNGAGDFGAPLCEE